MIERNEKFEIRLEVNRAARTLTISDTGIGMTRDEMIANIGTIAKSSTAEFQQVLDEKDPTAQGAELMGRFGVGLLFVVHGFGSGHASRPKGGRFRFEKGYEVLYMAQGVDGLSVQHLFACEEKRLKSVEKGAIEIRTDSEKSEGQKRLESRQQEFNPLIEFPQKSLAQDGKRVRESACLTTSPACLVVEDHKFSPILERALNHRIAGPNATRVQEINPNHDFISKVWSRLAANFVASSLANAAKVLHGVALLAEESQLTAAARFNRAAPQIQCQAL